MTKDEKKLKELYKKADKKHLFEKLKDTHKKLKKELY